MSSFRKRKQCILRGGIPLHHYEVFPNGDGIIVVPSLATNSRKELYPEAPTLDELLSSGVSVKDVSVDGILDSYDMNDIPNVDEVIEDCIKDVKKAKNKNNNKNENK